jgi:hypothetical protein
VSVAVACVWLTAYFLAHGSYLKFLAWKPDLSLWKKMLGIGLPAGVEFALLAVYLVIVYTSAAPTIKRTWVRVRSRSPRSLRRCALWSATVASVARNMARASIAGYR